MVREAVVAFNGDVQVEAFSSLKKQGVDKLRRSWITGLTTIAPITEQTTEE
jgi:GTP-binding protein